MLNIPNKSHFKLNEVCGLTGVKPYVLRFWENEFSEIDPILSSSGQKLYEHKDIEAIAVIKKMLFDEKMSVEQAKMELNLRLARPAANDEFSTESTVDDSSTVVSRMELSENDIKGLNDAKAHLRHIISRVDELKLGHQWQ